MKKKTLVCGFVGGYFNSPQFQEDMRRLRPLHLLREKREKAKAAGDVIMEEEYNRLFLLKQKEIEKSMMKD